MILKYTWCVISAIFISSAFSVAISKPNIVMLYIENMEEVATILKSIKTENISKAILPNIYALTKESIQFHNVYGEVSSTSNFAALLTGVPAVDLGIIRGKLLPFDSFPSLASTGSLKQEETTIAEVLKTCGYRTWFTGYWKLGLGEKCDAYPIKHGFGHMDGYCAPTQ